MPVAATDSGYGVRRRAPSGKQAVRGPAVMVVLAMLAVMGLEAAVVVGVRAAHLRHADQPDGAAAGAKVAGFHIRWQGGAAEPTPSETGGRLHLASLELPRPRPRPAEPSPPPEIPAALLPPLPKAFDHRPGPWLGPDAAEVLAAMIQPVEPLDRHPAPWLGPEPTETILAALIPWPTRFDTREPPRLPAPEPLLEPHMQVGEDWITQSRLHGHPGARKVRFNANVEARCLPSTLLTVLNDAAVLFGDITVISGYRNPARNRAVGGASRSMHLECRAIDFYAPGAAGGLVSWLVGRKDVGGYKRYPFGSYHIDNGPRRTW